VQKEKCKSRSPCKFLLTITDVCLAVTVTMQSTSSYVATKISILRVRDKHTSATIVLEP
jgi:hypothetical protein